MITISNDLARRCARNLELLADSYVELEREAGRRIERADTEFWQDALKLRRAVRDDTLLHRRNEKDVRAEDRADARDTRKTKRSRR